MRKLTLFLFTSLSIFLASCSTMRAPSINMLETRADYNGELKADAVLEGQAPLLVPNRTRAKVTDIWVHPHEMPTGDYFRGGWIRTLISRSQWEMERIKAPLTKKEVRKKIENRPKKKKRETARLLDRSKAKAKH